MEAGRSNNSRPTSATWSVGASGNYIMFSFQQTNQQNKTAAELVETADVNSIAGLPEAQDMGEYPRESEVML